MINFSFLQHVVVAQDLECRCQRTSRPNEKQTFPPMKYIAVTLFRDRYHILYCQISERVLCTLRIFIYALALSICFADDAQQWHVIRRSVSGPTRTELNVNIFSAAICRFRYFNACAFHDTFDIIYAYLYRPASKLTWNSANDRSTI